VVAAGRGELVFGGGNTSNNRSLLLFEMLQHHSRCLVGRAFHLDRKIASPTSQQTMFIGSFKAETEPQ